LGRLAGLKPGPYRLRNPCAERFTELEEGVLDAEVVEYLVVLEIFGIEDAAIGLEGGGYDEGVVPGEGMAAAEPESVLVEGI
jgi:hypothetical protein